MSKSWHLNRRTFLHGAGVSLALPFLECMAADSKTLKRPKRMAGVYFPYGVSLPNEKHEDAAWNWFPRGEGRDFRFNNSLKGLESLRSEVTVLGGLSHPNGRKMGGHDTCDIFLTGASFKGSQFTNSISIDQVVAERVSEQTRFSSLALSTDGGVGEPTRSSTLSFGRTGQPIPAQSSVRQVYDRMFGANSDSLEAQRRELKNSGSMLDLVLENAKSLRGRLGNQDQAKFDEYLDSVRSIEQRVERSERWLDIPKPKVDASSLHLEADDNTPKEFIRTMYDLMYLAFLTDSTRVATYQLGSMNGATSLAGKFPSLMGFSKNNHGLAHGAGKPGGFKELGRWDQFQADQLAYFLGV